MDSRIEQRARATMQAARMTGIAVAVARSGEEPELLATGTDHAGNPLTADSLFPVASVTKLGTALAVLRLADSGILSVDDPLARHLPHAVAAAHQGVTLRRILSHTAGLPFDLPSGFAPYAPGLHWQALAEGCLHTPLRKPPMTVVQYSNVGYGLLALAVERVTGRAFADALQSLVLVPLAIEGRLGVEPPRQPTVLADVRGRHAGTSLEPFNSAFWRSLAMPWGGLVATVGGVLALVRAFAGIPAGFLGPGTLADATANQTDDLSGGFVRPLIWPRCPWGLGPELRDRKSPHWAPASAAHDSFGHSGASGSLAWYDPQKEVAWTIIGTRTADSGWLVRLAPRLGEAILAALGST